MTPAARHAAAITVLDAWQDGEPVERALLRWSRGARYAGSGDRAAVRDHVFDILRSLGRCRALGGGKDGRALMLGWLRLTEQDADATFTGKGYAPATLVETERDAPVMAVSPIDDIPPWAQEPLARQFGHAVDELAEALTTRAPVYLRVNRRKGARDTASEALQRDGVTTEAVAACDTALRVLQGARKIRQSHAYRDGLVELQDLSVQMAVSGVPWPKDGRILDYCAGGGGKTLAIADLSDAQFFAHDADPSRMADLTPRAQRAGVSVTELDTDVITTAAPFDAVLCDVPCSGSGTWRRDPDAKWRLDADGLGRLTEVQDIILAEAASLVVPCGMLVYMTCSLFEEENMARIDAFLSRVSGWTLRADTCFTPISASDGFFVAHLERADGVT